MMIIEYMGEIAWKGTFRELRHGFLLSTDNSIVELGKKNVGIIGLGENAFFCEKLLLDKGVFVNHYADNDMNVVKHLYHGRIVETPKSLIENGIYPIITVSEANLNSVRMQMFRFGVKSYSLFLNLPFHSFLYENKELNDVLIEMINLICFENENLYNSLPLIGPSGEKARDGLAKINYLISSLQWSHLIYNWVIDYLKQNVNAKVLEIGPGYGLMSSVLLHLFPEIKMEWLLFGREECFDRNASYYERGLEKIQQIYRERIKSYNRYLEIDNLDVEEEYDVIIMSEVFEHFVVNPVETMKKVKNLLSKKGKLFFTTPNWGHLPIYETWKDMPDANGMSEENYLFQINNSGHCYQYNKDEIKEIMNDAELEIIKYGISDGNNHNIVMKKLEVRY